MGKHSQQHKASKYHGKIEPVAGLAVLHLAGNTAQEDALLCWELTFLPPV